MAKGRTLLTSLLPCPMKSTMFGGFALFRKRMVFFGIFAGSFLGIASHVIG
jgi:hypothetical protein